MTKIVLPKGFSVVYETPNKEWVIVKEKQGRWSVIFDVPMYSARKFSEKKHKENGTKAEERVLSDYIIMHSFEEIESGFKWLRWMKVISSDEMDYNIKLLKGL